jgi:hypothetical protein
MAKRSRIRIKGLVSLMNRVRERWRVGVPADEAEQFRAMVREGVRTVEAICRREGATPDDLPGPSRRAYAYLKGLDLDAVPVRSDAPSEPPGPIYLSGVVATCNYYHNEFRHAVEDADGDVTDAAVERLAKELRSDADAIADLCREEGGTPANLPTQSRRGYQWLAFLSEPENLALHLETLRLALQAGESPARRKPLPPAQRDLPLKLQFHPTSTLYRTRVKKRHIDVLANEGFVGAPNPVIEALMSAALGDKSPAHRAKVKAHAQSEAFEDIVLSLELTTEPATTDTAGQHYDLADVFERVNAQYFDGALERPHLTWNKTLTRRKLGHYHTRTDTVMVSLTLDSAEIPRYVIDYVMYHELLHKQVGVEVVNGRRYAHTSEFREAEQAFEHYEQVQDFLAQRPAP